MSVLSSVVGSDELGRRNETAARLGGCMRTWGAHVRYGMMMIAAMEDAGRVITMQIVPG
jgi:hypothetical protein